MRCHLMTTDSVTTDAALVSVHPQTVRLHLTVKASNGDLSLAHLELAPLEALRLAMQLNEAHIAALQTTAGDTK